MAGRFSGGTGWTRCALTALLLGAGGWTAPALAQSDLSTQFSPATDPTLLNEAGWASIAARNYDKAKSDFEAAIAADPQMLDARRGLARAYAGLEDMDSAMRIIEPLRTVSPVFQLELAALLLIAEQPERALSEIDRAVAWAQERAARQDGARIARQFEKRATMLRGEALYLLGGYEAAMEQFEAAHRILPSASSWRAIGDTYLAQGDRTNAMTAYSEALRLRRYDGLAYRRRARVRFLEGDYEGAIGDYREAQVSLDESRDLLAEFSEALLAAEAYGDAVTVLNRLLPHTRGDEEAERTVRYHLASAMIEAGRLRDAEQQIASIGTWKGKEVPLLFLRGRAKIGLGDYATAYRIFSAALEQRRGDPQLLYNRGLASLRLNNVERALDDLAEASVRAPQNSQIRDAIGQIKLFQGKFDEGIAFYNAGVAAHKDDPAPLVQRARALLTIGQAQRALEDASRALELDPDSTDAAGAAAMAYLQLGDPVASRAYSDRLVASRTRKREGYILRARASIAEGLPNDGLSAIEQARNFGAPETQLALLEGDAHAAMDAYEDAAVAYERAIMLNPSLTQARVRHGDAMVQINRLDEAAEDYRAALAAVPGSLSLRMKHAEALRQGGRCQDAIEQYDMVLTMAPEHAQALRGRGKCRISEGPFFAGLSDMISSFF